MQISKQLKVLRDQLPELGAGLDSRHRDNQRIRDENVRLMVANWFPCSQSFQSIFKNGRELNVLIENCPVCNEPLLEDGILSVLALGGSRSRLIHKLH